ncbi:MAG TPA: response regulator transcription factor [Candidatus Wallbacteria bacterium]|nr:response regulator transcription factor [Candidatus Wallbacteria bacterium]
MTEHKNNIKILMIEDDESLAAGLSAAFKIEGISVTAAATFREGEAAVNQVMRGGESFDLIVLDLTLPDGSGFDILKLVRSFSDSLPVLILSARSGEIDKVVGLESGADDFVSKPFSLRELHARIKTILRRSAAGSFEKRAPVFKYDDMAVDFMSREVLIAGKPVKLSFTEFQVLKILIENKNMVVEREKLLERVWSGVYIDTRSVDPHISRIRKKIAPYGQLIETIPNIGYKMKIREQL